MNEWFNYTATAKILVFGLLVGAALPALFAVGMRVHTAGSGTVDGGAATARRPALVALGWLIFLLVLLVVVLGVLFIARDFIAHRTGWHILGASAGS